MRLPVTPRISTKNGVANQNGRLTNTLKEKDKAVLRPGLALVSDYAGDGNGLIPFNGSLVRLFADTIYTGGASFPLLSPPYSASSTYNIGDSVWSNGELWFSIIDGNTGNTPASGVNWARSIDTYPVGYIELTGTFSAGETVTGPSGLSGKVVSVDPYGTAGRMIVYGASGWPDGVSVDGPNGSATSADVMPRGAWAAENNYAVRDLISRSGSTYRCITAHQGTVAGTYHNAGYTPPVLCSGSASPGAAQTCWLANGGTGSGWFPGSVYSDHYVVGYPADLSGGTMIVNTPLDCPSGYSDVGGVCTITWELGNWSVT